MSDYPLTNITNPSSNDILCGRGGGTNAHPGNIKFRKLVAAHKLRYLAASKSDKPGVAREVVKEWRSMSPPGRFLAKLDPKQSPSNYDSKLIIWNDVGDKKAREKASQCLRERNGAANEAVAALVKTVTATGEACPEDYATLMNKAALVKAQNDLTIRQQNEMLKMQNQVSQGMGMGSMGGNMGGGFGGGESFEPISLQHQQQQMNNSMNSQSGYGGGYGGMGNNSNNSNFQGPSEDEAIEAEIKRLLQQRQQTLMGGGGSSGGGGGNSSNSNPQGGNMYGTGGMGGGSLNDSNRSGRGTQQGAYMGEDSILREYEQLMNKQREFNMMTSQAGMGNMNNMGGMNNNMGGGLNNSFTGMNNNNMGGMMNNDMNNSFTSGMPQDFNTKNMGGGSMGGNNDFNNNSSGTPGKNQHNPDAAKDYMNRLRSMRQGGNGTPDQAASSSQGFNNNSSANGMGMMNNSVPHQQMMQGQGNGGSGKKEEFTIEEYQASLQQFLSHGGGVGGAAGNNNFGGSNTGGRPARTMSQATTLAGNLSGAGEGGQQQYESVQVPTNMNDGNPSKKKRPYSRRRSIDDIDVQYGGKPQMEGGKGHVAFANKLFQSVTSEERPSFLSMDDMDIRGTFRSVDTMDLMSIGNSINEIMDDDIKNNPEMRKKYAERRLSNAGENDYVFNPGETIEINTMDHGRGSTAAGGAKKRKDTTSSKGIDPRLIAQAQAAGTKLTVQTKSNDGPKSNAGMGGRGSQLSMNMNFDGLDDDSRMSFGNM